MSEAWALASVIGLLSTGAASALLRKVMFQMPGVGLGGVVHTFKKPFFTTLDSAIACSTGLLFHYFHLWHTHHGVAATRRQHMQQHSLDQQQGPGPGSLSKPLLDADDAESAFAKDAATNAALEDTGRFVPISRRLAWKLMWPALFGRLALISQGMGLKYVSASMNQMVAASCIVFTAILSVTVLKRKLNGMHVTGIILVLVGVAIVSFAHDIFAWLAGEWPLSLVPTPLTGQLLSQQHGAMLTQPGFVEGATSSTAAAVWEPASLLCNGSSTAQSLQDRLPWQWHGSVPGQLHKKHRHHGTRKEMALGIGLILLSQLFQACQLILEEVLLGGSEALAPMEVIGWEGLLAIGWMSFVFLPLAQFLPGTDVGGVQENTLDSLVMLARNLSVCTWNAVYLATVAGTNLFGLLVAAFLGSVFRAVLLAARTALVWAAALLIHALHIGGGEYGEVWEGDSWVTLVGFLLLLCGTVLYAQGSSKVAKVAELHPDDDAREVVQRIESYALATANRSVEDLGLFDGLIDKDSWEHERQRVLGSSPRSQSGSSRRCSMPLQMQRNERQHELLSSRSMIEGAERLGVPLSARTLSFLHPSSWIKDRDDRAAAVEAADR